MNKNTKPATITNSIYQKILELLKKNPKGLRWSELLKKLNEAGEFHPKTVNGCIWKLTQKFPDKVHKPEKGLFKLKPHKSSLIIDPELGKIDLNHGLTAEQKTLVRQTKTSKSF